MRPRSRLHDRRALQPHRRELRAVGIGGERRALLYELPDAANAADETGRRLGDRDKLASHQHVQP